MAKRYGMVIDLDLCVGCHSCTVACKAENGLAPHEDDEPGTPGFAQPNPRWNWVFTIGPTGTWPNLEMHYLPVLCNHCDDPACVKVCPTGASYKREDGVVLVDKDKCIGCQYCTMACPYGARFFETDSGVVGKCTFCAHRVDAGLEPFCVTHCMAKARFFGDLNDPNSEVSEKVREAGDGGHVLRPDMRTKPSVHYILKKSTWKGRA